LKSSKNQTNVVEKIIKSLDDSEYSKFRISYVSGQSVFPRIARVAKILSKSDLVGKRVKGVIRNVWGNHVLLRLAGKYTFIEIPYQFEGKVDVK